MCSRQVGSGRRFPHRDRHSPPAHPTMNGCPHLRLQLFGDDASEDIDQPARRNGTTIFTGRTDTPPPHSVGPPPLQWREGKHISRSERHPGVHLRASSITCRSTGRILTGLRAGSWGRAAQVTFSDIYRPGIGNDPQTLRTPRCAGGPTPPVFVRRMWSAMRPGSTGCFICRAPHAPRTSRYLAVSCTDIGERIAGQAEECPGDLRESFNSCS